MLEPNKPELQYPEFYCHDCGEHIREKDFFGRSKALGGQVFCPVCYLFFKPDAELNLLSEPL